jgi:glycosyltransferase involved in cell wall biosynthesis
MAACDVLIMPWRNSDWIRACNPVKLKEYLAVGKPVVSTPFEELRRYDGLVRVARNSDEFAAQIRQVMTTRPDGSAGRRRIRRETWAAKAQTVLDALYQDVAS